MLPSIETLLLKRMAEFLLLLVKKMVNTSRWIGRRDAV